MRKGARPVSSPSEGTRVRRMRPARRPVIPAAQRMRGRSGTAGARSSARRTTAAVPPAGSPPRHPRPGQRDRAGHRRPWPPRDRPLPRLGRTFGCISPLPGRTAQEGQGEDAEAHSPTMMPGGRPGTQWPWGCHRPMRRPCQPGETAARRETIAEEHDCRRARPGASVRDHGASCRKAPAFRRRPDCKEASPAPFEPDGKAGMAFRRACCAGPRRPRRRRPFMRSCRSPGPGTASSDRLRARTS